MKSKISTTGFEFIRYDYLITLGNWRWILKYFNVKIVLNIYDFKE